MDLVSDYIISLTHLYGLVHREKIVEIYNMHSDGEIYIEDVDTRANNIVPEFNKNHVEVHGDYFVHETIMEFDEFEQELSKRQGKPFYIPDQQELLKYKNNLYFEKTREYKALEKYVQHHFFNGDAFKAEMLCEDVQGFCQFAFSMRNIFESFNQRGVVFDNEDQVDRVTELIMNLANNTRLWENNGLTPNELSKRKTAQMNHGATTNKKVGRNEPCPCGSGKKYKKCCGA